MSLKRAHLLLFTLICFSHQALACVTIPQGTTYQMSSSETLCLGTYWNVSIVLDADDVVLDCNSSVLNGTVNSISQTAITVSSNVDRTTVKNCNIINYEKGYSITHSDFTEDDYVINNTFINTSTGVEASLNDHLWILNNTFVRARFGLDASWGDNYVISGNNFTQTYQTAMDFSWGIRYSVIENNIVKDSLGNGGYQLDVSGQFTDCAIRNNHFENINSSAILLTGNFAQTRVNVTNNTVINSTSGYAMTFYGSTNGWIANNVVNGSFWNGMRFHGSGVKNNLIENNTLVDGISSGSTGMYLFLADNNTIRNNYVEGHDYVIYLTQSSDANRVYNNKFMLGTNDPYSFNVTNSFNTSEDCSAQNIVGGPCVGGNFWGKTTLDGFSDTCDDVDSDGFCDTSYSVNLITDYLPLTENPNNAPVLANPLVVPDVAVNGSLFNFTVNYTDQEAEAPTYINLTLGAAEYEMSLDYGSHDTGAIYSVGVTINTHGDYTYIFEASDGNSTASTPTYDGPIVTSESSCTGGANPPYTGDWLVDSAITCQDSGFLASNTQNLNISDVLTLQDARVYINQSLVVFHDSSRLVLDGSILKFL